MLFKRNNDEQKLDGQNEKLEKLEKQGTLAKNHIKRQKDEK